MLPIIGWTLLVLGIFVWLFGNRMWLLGAGAGALLGFGLINWIPPLSTGWLGFIIVAGLAILFGVLGILGKAFTKLIAMTIGFIAGGALVIAFFGIFNISVSFLTWIIALLGGLVGAGLFARFVNWGLIIFASLLGAMLVVRGLMGLSLDFLDGVIGSVVVVVLTIVGIFYHARQAR
jgi:hypothetical protein